ncbi:molecular chaperone TorD family protein [Chloroflexota bacterium]
MKNEAVLNNDISQILVGEMLLLRLLGKALYSEPERKWLEELIAEQIFFDIPFGMEQPEIIHGFELLQRWSQANTGGISEADFADLKMDYTRLFIGLDVHRTAPWESVYFNRDRFVFQEQTIQVREWYARYDVQAEKLNREPDDHIGLEILFISHLASLALQALEQNDQNQLDEMLQAQREFLSEHLLRWGLVWAKLVKQHAATDFYRGIAHLTHGALLAIAEILEITMPKEVTL